MHPLGRVGRPHAEGGSGVVRRCRGGGVAPRWHRALAGIGMGCLSGKSDILGQRRTAESTDSVQVRGRRLQSNWRECVQALQRSSALRLLGSDRFLWGGRRSAERLGWGLRGCRPLVARSHLVVAIAATRGVVWSPMVTTTSRVVGGGGRKCFGGAPLFVKYSAHMWLCCAPG